MCKQASLIASAVLALVVTSANECRADNVTLTVTPVQNPPPFPNGVKWFNVGGTYALNQAQNTIDVELWLSPAYNPGANPPPVAYWNKVTITNPVGPPAGGAWTFPQFFLQNGLSNRDLQAWLKVQGNYTSSSGIFTFTNVN
jgi:hypothetical protein